MSESSQNNTKNGKLLPCPFCGGEAELHQTYDMDTNEVDGWFVWCNNKECECTPETREHFTEAEAIAAWNTRAEQTCRMVEKQEEPQDDVLVRDYEFSCGHCIEDVLLDVIEYAACHSNSWNEIVAKYADELRELCEMMEVCE